MITHRILAIGDASRDALEAILDAVGTLRKERLAVRIILFSFLSFLSGKRLEPLGPNTLFLLMQEEEDILDSAGNYFRMLEIPCSLRLMTSPAWKETLEEMAKGDQELIILQGRFLELWNGDPERLGFRPGLSCGPACPVLVIEHPEERRIRC